MPLKALPRSPSYLNLLNTKFLNTVEVVNKYVVDNEIAFSKPEQITHVFYDIQFNEDRSIKTVFFAIIRTPQDTTGLPKIDTEGNESP